MKKVLVTGATGFIGNYVIAELEKLNYEIIATSSSEKKAKESVWFNKIQYIPFDLALYDKSINYFEFFNYPDVVLHLAWQGLPNYNADFHLTVNYLRHSDFLENLVYHGLKSLTVTGTCLEYGIVEGCVSETIPCDPVTTYGKAKLKLMERILHLQDTMNFEFKWIRLFYMYGKGQNPKSLISQLEEALSQNKEYFDMSGGEQERDFLDVKTVSRYIVSIAFQTKVKGVINCCSGVPIRVKDFVRAYLRRLDKNIKLNLGIYPYTEYEPMSFWGDTEKLNVALAS